MRFLNIAVIGVFSYIAKESSKVFPISEFMFLVTACLHNKSNTKEFKLISFQLFCK